MSASLRRLEAVRRRAGTRGRRRARVRGGLRPRAAASGSGAVVSGQTCAVRTTATFAVCRASAPCSLARGCGQAEEELPVVVRLRGVTAAISSSTSEMTFWIVTLSSWRRYRTKPAAYASANCVASSGSSAVTANVRRSVFAGAVTVEVLRSRSSCRPPPSTPRQPRRPRHTGQLGLRFDPPLDRPRQARGSNRPPNLTCDIEAGQVHVGRGGVAVVRWLAPHPEPPARTGGDAGSRSASVSRSRSR